MPIPVVDLSRLRALGRLFSEADNIVFLTGAGMSTESGIPDFRSSAGLYASVANQGLFDIDLFRRTPEYFYERGRDFLCTIRKAQPNEGHFAIARLEQEWGKTVNVVTQNIDDLHQQAGSTTVHPIHGTLETFTCMSCHAQVRADELWPQIEAGQVPRHDSAACSGVFKPDIVFFREMLPGEVVAAAHMAIRAADLLVIAGTSLTVYPAAALPGVRWPDCGLVVINKSSTNLDEEADIVFRDSVGVTLAAALELVDTCRACRWPSKTKDGPAVARHARLCQTACITEARHLPTRRKRMDIYQAIAARKSVRVFQDKDVPEEVLLRLLGAARLAPSASNRQEWRFVVVRDPAVRMRLAVAARNQRFVGEAPVLLACCAETDEHLMACGQVCYPIDVAIAMDHISLCATAEGLGTCWIGAFDEAQVKAILGVPDGVRVVELMPLGYPKDPAPAPKQRLPLEAIVRRDRW